MDKQFWLNKWHNNTIGFHKDIPNPKLVQCFDGLALQPQQRIFLPLCGKTLDVGWLLARDCHVVGVELSEQAIVELFDELGVEPERCVLECGLRYSAPGIDMFVGDFFDLSAELLGAVDAVYDRAALIALPEAMRCRYADHLRKITCGVAQLLITVEYDTCLMEGPPFSVSAAEVLQRYAPHYYVEALVTTDVQGGLKGGVPAEDTAWLLGPARNV